MPSAPKPLIIFGTGDIAQLAAFYFTEDSNHRVVAFAVDATYRKADHFNGKPLVDFETIQNFYSPQQYDLFVAVSYTQINALRRDKCKEARAKGYNLASYISSHTTVFSNFSCGDNCFILEDNTIQPFVQIGNNVTFWSGNHIGHHSKIEDDVFISSHVVVAGGVTVGRGSFLGVNATLRDHISIGVENVIGAGAIILKNTPDYAVFKSESTQLASVTSQKLRNI